MDVRKKIKMSLAFAGMSEAELSRRLGTSPSAFNQRMQSGSLRPDDLERIASELGAEFICKFRFPDGTEI
jgi:transcriptional regulator with XRE-family HTH domain